MSAQASTLRPGARERRWRRVRAAAARPARARVVAGRRRPLARRGLRPSPGAGAEERAAGMAPAALPAAGRGHQREQCGATLRRHTPGPGRACGRPRGAPPASSAFSSAGTGARPAWRASAGSRRAPSRNRRRRRPPATARRAGGAAQSKPTARPTTSAGQHDQRRVADGAGDAERAMAAGHRTLAQEQPAHPTRRPTAEQAVSADAARRRRGRTAGEHQRRDQEEAEIEEFTGPKSVVPSTPSLPWPHRLRRSRHPRATGSAPACPPSGDGRGTGGGLHRRRIRSDVSRRSARPTGDRRSCMTRTPWVQPVVTPVVLVALREASGRGNTDPSQRPWCDRNAESRASAPDRRRCRHRQMPPIGQRRPPTPSRRRRPTS